MMARTSAWRWFGSRVFLAVLAAVLWQTVEHRGLHPLEFSPVVASAEGVDGAFLHAGEAAKRSLPGGDTHSYQFEFAAGNYAHLLVEQAVIESEIALFDPNGQQILH